MGDFHALVDEQTGRLSALGHRLSDAQWNAASLCAGWRIRDVYGHITLGCTMPIRRLGALTLFRYRGNLDRAWLTESVRYSSGLSQTELLTRYDQGRARPKGAARLVPWSIIFGDQLIHELDIRRPLGIEEPFAPESLVAVLDLCVKLVTPQAPTAWRCRGLTLRATDVDWSREVPGAPTVSGLAEDIVLAVAGRHAGLTGLHGDGVPVLAERTGAQPVPS